MKLTAHKKDKEINLLPQEGFSSTPFGRVLMWILSSFRIIVIVTEIIVMVSFLSRFWLDANNTDLNEEMQEKASLVAAQELFEKEFRTTQDKIAIFNELTQNEGIVSDSLEEIVEGLPADVFLDQIQFSAGAVDILGISPSERSIQQFIVNLEAKEIFVEVQLDDIKTNIDNPELLEFTVQTKT